MNDSEKKDRKERKELRKVMFALRILGGGKLAAWLRPKNQRRNLNINGSPFIKN